MIQSSLVALLLLSTLINKTLALLPVSSLSISARTNLITMETTQLLDRQGEVISFCSNPRKMALTEDPTSAVRSESKNVEGGMTTNRLFLSQIDYTNNGNDELSHEVVKSRLETLFSRFGSVQEIFLSEKEDMSLQKEKKRPPFAFIAMETAEEAQAALRMLSTNITGDNRKLFRDIAPAKVHQSKNNQQNKNDRLREARLKEFRQRKEYATTSNVVCQVHTSHLDRLENFITSSFSFATIIGSYSVQKGTSFLFVSVNDPEEENETREVVEAFSRALWGTWFVAPNLNRVTALTSPFDDEKTIQGTIRDALVPGVFKALSQLVRNDPRVAPTTLTLRLAIYPPKLQRTILEALDDCNRNREKSDHLDGCEHLDIQFSPSNPTHTISILQLHPGIAVNPEADINNKALYALGRLESVQTKESVQDTTYRYQQQPTSVVPQSSNNERSLSHNSNLKQVNDDNKSISRAYWKLQEAWERYEYGALSLEETSGDHKLLWALDCGAAPGGWTKFLFRPSRVQRLYAVDPGRLSASVVPGLDRAMCHSAPLIEHVETTIQTALPQIARELRDSGKECLDIWVSDMCCKDMAGQIDCFLQAREEGVVGTGTFFVLTLKCVVGFSATAFEYQTNLQVARLNGISRDVQVLHLFSNRNSERTIIGYLC